MLIVDKFLYFDFVNLFLFSCFFFFFSSRRRHTRSTRDWSSDGALPISRRGRHGGGVSSRPMRGSRARNTSPMPPAPSSAVTSYGPSLVPGVMDTLLLQVNPHTLDRKSVVEGKSIDIDARSRTVQRGASE